MMRKVAYCSSLQKVMDYLCLFIVRILPVAERMSFEVTPAPVPCTKSRNVLKHCQKSMIFPGHFRTVFYSHLHGASERREGGSLQTPNMQLLTVQLFLVFDAPCEVQPNRPRKETQQSPKNPTILLEAKI